MIRLVFADQHFGDSKDALTGRRLRGLEQIVELMISFLRDRFGRQQFVQFDLKRDGQPRQGFKGRVGVCRRAPSHHAFEASDGFDGDSGTSGQAGLRHAKALAELLNSFCQSGD